MQRALGALEGEEFDLLVVGAGVHGAFAAWDAALRGLRVALVDRGDFGGAASANSMKIAHGGLRYLQQGDLARMRESIGERRRLMRMAPHLVRPLPCAMPTWGIGMRGAAALGVALILNDVVSLDRNRGIEPARRLPRGRLLSRDAYREVAGPLAVEWATGGALWPDALIDGTERLLISVVRAAAEAGAVAANYVVVDEPLLRGGRVAGVRARCALEHAPLEIRARLVLNAAGAGAPALAARAGARVGVFFVRSCNAVVRRRGGAAAAAIPARAGGRMLFAVPWRDRLIVGTTQRAQGEEPLESGAARDVEELLRRIGESLPHLRLAPDDVDLVHAGLLPGPAAGESGDPDAPRRHPLVLDHEARDGVPGLVTMLGVKWTTARLVAERAVRLCARRLGRATSADGTRDRRVHGGEISAPGAPRDDAAAAGIAPAALARLRRLHGSALGEVLALAREMPSLADPLAPGSHAIGAEVVHAFRAEMAMRLEDVVLRRTELGNAGHPGEAVLRGAARIAAAELGWSSSRTEAEIAAVRARFPSPAATPAPEGAPT